MMPRQPQKRPAKTIVLYMGNYISFHVCLAIWEGMKLGCLSERWSLQKVAKVSLPITFAAVLLVP